MEERKAKRDKRYRCKKKEGKRKGEREGEQGER